MPVIEPDQRPSFELVNSFVSQVRGWLPQDHAGTEQHRQHVIPIGQDDRGYRLIKKPGADALIRQRESVNQEAIDVRPVDCGMRGMPDRSFSATVAGRRDANWLRREWGNYCTPIPASRPPSTR